MMLAMIPHQIKPERCMFRTYAEYLQARNQYVTVERRREQQRNFHHAFMLVMMLVLLVAGFIAFAALICLQLYAFWS